MEGKQHVQGCLRLRTTKGLIVVADSDQFQESFSYVSQEATRAALVQLLVQLEVGIKMQIGSLNSNEPCVSQPHQSQDHLPKSPPSTISLATSTEV